MGTTRAHLLARVHGARDDGLERDDHVCRDEHGVDRDLRLRAMAAAPLDLDRELRRVAHYRALGHPHVAQRHARPIVVAVHLIHPVHAAFGDHRQRTTRPFLCGLEEQPHCHVRRYLRDLALDEHGTSDQACHVTIVSAQVRDALVRRPVRKHLVLLRHAKRIHVGADRHRAHLLLAAARLGRALDVDDESRLRHRLDGCLRHVRERREQFAQR